MIKKLVIFYLVLVSVLAGFFGYKYFFHRVAGSYTGTAIAYTDGTGEIIVNDNVPDQIPHTYRLKTKAIWDESLKTFTPPEIAGSGGVWQRLVYTYNEKGNGCFSNIFYIDRVKKTSKNFKTGYCIIQTLDPRDITQFAGFNNDTKELVIGSYENGIVRAGVTLPAPTFSFVASNWEITKLAFAAGNCEREDPTGKIYIWDVDKGKLEDKTPKNFNCGTLRTVYYDHDKDAFYAGLDKVSGGTERIKLN